MKKMKIIISYINISFSKSLKKNENNNNNNNIDTNNPKSKLFTRIIIYKQEM
jgi:hypothetical protein